MVLFLCFLDGKGGKMLSKYQLAVAVKEQEYLKRLADYIRDSKLGEQWQITGFTSADACRRYMKQGYKIDLLAAQPELIAELESELPNIPVVALVLKLGENNGENELHQYQPLPLLLQRLVEIHARTAVLPVHTGGTAEAAAGARVISVYSAAGGTGKTALALHLAHAASTHRCRTFYLNLERWNTSEIWLGSRRNSNGINEVDVQNEGLSEFLYGLKAQPDQAVNWLMEHRKRDSLLQADYLAACTNMEDRMTLCEDDALGLVDVIVRSGQYDLIVIDLESGLDELHAVVFERSNQVLWVLNDEASVRNKHAMAFHYGEQKWGNRFNRMSSKFITVKNHAAQVEIHSSRAINGLAYAQVQLPEIPQWRGASSVALLSSPQYRAAVDKLFKQLSPEGAED
jgi:cellulose biosynthesis protein BcsQ